MNIDINRNLNTNNVSFGVKLGPKLWYRIYKEQGYSQIKIYRYAKMLNDNFTRLDKDTIVDINTSGRFVFSHQKFPQIKTLLGFLDRRNNLNIGESLIMTCPKDMKRHEHYMLRNIVVELVNKGENTTDLRKLATKLFENNTEAREYFIEYIRFAEAIKQEKTLSKLPKKITNEDMINMELKIIDAEMDTPGTWAHKVTHHIYY